VARSTGTLWAVHDGLQSLQPLVSTRHLEADFRHVGVEIARQFVSDRQHDRESPPCRQRRKRGEQNQAIGISRGGRSTKIHAIVDSKGRPLNFTLTGGQVHDSQVVGEVLDTARPPLAVTADKAYDSEKVRQQIKDEGALPVIPSRSNATKKAYCPKRFYRRRHKIENYIRVLKEHAAGLSAGDACRKYGISDGTFYKWRSRYGGMEISDARKLKALEDENRRLKKLLAETMLDASTLKEMLGKNF